MNKLKMLLLTAMAAAMVGTGAFAAAPSASAAPPPPPPDDTPCSLHTNLGTIKYPHLSQITVISNVDHKEHTYLCVSGTWYEVKAAPTRTTTFVGSLSGVLTRR